MPVLPSKKAGKMAVDPKGLETRVQGVFELNREFIELSGSGLIQKLGPPASEKRFRAFEETLGLSLPHPSEPLSFPAMACFEGDIRLLSIAEMARGKYAERVQVIKKRAWSEGETLLIEGLISGPV